MNFVQQPPKCEILKYVNLSYSNNDSLNEEVKIRLVDNDSELKPVIQPSCSYAKAERGSAVRQVFAAFAANLGTVNTGLVFGFSAVVLPQLKSPTSAIPIDQEQASWIGSIFFMETFLSLLLQLTVRNARGAH